ncbi:MAG: hypothetical protein CMK09_08150 [Ponticaulis sp.]|nr:hypothetical protein [Ponticaulis sp.]
MADIFISYKREEGEQAQRLAHVLEQLGYSVWWDVALLSGDEFRDVIQEMIEKCSAVVVLWSPLSVQSRFVRSEADYAQRRDKLLPVILKPCELPLGFSEDHADNLEDWTGELMNSGLQRLLNSIQNLTGKPAVMSGPSPESARQKAEITAFQGVARMNSAAAWQQFLKDHPATMFRDFITQKIAELEAAVQNDSPPVQPILAHSPDIETTELVETNNHPSDPDPIEDTRTTIVRTSGHTEPSSKKRFIITAGIFAVVLLGGISAAMTGVFGPDNVVEPIEEVVASPADQAAWNLANRLVTREAYQSYLADFEDGFYAKHAKAAIADIEDNYLWDTAKNTNSIASYQDYLDTIPDGKFASQAREKIAAITLDQDWAKAKATNTTAAYEAFLTAHPGSAHASEARQKIRELDAAATKKLQDENDRKDRRARAAADREADDKAWSVAKAANTTAAYQSYLTNYSSGRHVTEARSAIVALDKPAPYSLDQLHPQVRAAVVKARDAEKQAQAKAAEARTAATRADEAAARARAGAAGTTVQTLSNGKYEGEFSNGTPNGYGVSSFTSGDFVGDTYRGQRKDGAFSGVGVYTYEENPENSSVPLKYEGEYLSDEVTGFGVHTWPGGDFYAGGFKQNQRSGSGVLSFTSGLRLEGLFASNFMNGLGVEWKADGTVNQAGRWEDNKLVESLTK